MSHPRGMDYTPEQLQAECERIQEKLNGPIELCKILDLPVSAKRARCFRDEALPTIIDSLVGCSDRERWFEKWDNLYLAATRILLDIEDEAETRIFFAVDSRSAELLDDRAPFGTDVQDSIPGAAYDVEEAAKCLALERNTACVFHLMRAMESGLRLLADSLGDPSLAPERNPTWERILKRGDQELQKGFKEQAAEWRKRPQFFSEAIADIRAVKSAWRNPTMHVDKKYDEQQAKEIFNSVRAFIRHLASGLKASASEGV